MGQAPKGLPNLEWLWLKNTHFTNAGLEKLRTAIPGLQIVC